MATTKTKASDLMQLGLDHGVKPIRGEWIYPPDEKKVDEKGFYKNGKACAVGTLIIGAELKKRHGKITFDRMEELSEQYQGYTFAPLEYNELLKKTFGNCAVKNCDPENLDYNHTEYNGYTVGEVLNHLFEDHKWSVGRIIKMLKDHNL